jgi:hypothetical protein
MAGTDPIPVLKGAQGRSREQDGGFARLLENTCRSAIDPIANIGGCPISYSSKMSGWSVNGVPALGRASFCRLRALYRDRYVGISQSQLSDQDIMVGLHRALGNAGNHHTSDKPAVRLMGAGLFR